MVCFDNVVSSSSRHSRCRCRCRQPPKSCEHIQPWAPRQHILSALRQMQDECVSTWLMMLTPIEGGGMTYRHKRVQFNCYLYLYWLAFALMGSIRSEQKFKMSCVLVKNGCILFLARFSHAADKLYGAAYQHNGTGELVELSLRKWRGELRKLV